jgi:CheY-like chemotaxis protein
MLVPPLILVVDDDPDILETVSELLEEEHYRVARARNGKEALERVAEEAPALILLDLMMPVMDGFTFATELRKLPAMAKIPILVITAEGNPSRSRQLGAQGFLAKPFDIDTLLDKVRELLNS